MPKRKLAPVFLSPAEITTIIEILTHWTQQVEDRHAETAIAKLTRAKEKPVAQAQ